MSNSADSPILPARLWLPLVIAVAVCVATLLVSEVSYRLFTHAKVEIGQGLTLRTKLLQLEKTIIQAEASQRGYLLTRKSSYLEPFQQAIEQIQPIQREIMDYVHDEKLERDRLTEVNSLIALKLGEMERTIKVANTEDFDRALAVVEGDEGRQLSDKLRAAFANFDAAVSQQMQQQSAEWESSAETSRSAIVTVVGLNVILIAMLALLLIRDQRMARKMQVTQNSYAELLENEVARRTGELSSLSAYLQTNSEKEKAALARELHDELGGILTPAKMDLAWLQGRLSENKEFADRMRRLSSLIDQGIDLKRRIIENLRPSLIDHLGLPAALQWYVEETCNAANLPFELKMPETLERLPGDLEITLYRIVQESVTNAVRHAHAKRIDVSLERTEKGIRIEIADDGIGIRDLAAAKRSSQSHGLAGMDHRVRSVHGTFDVRSRPGEGTRVAVFVPLEEGKKVPGTERVG